MGGFIEKAKTEIVGKKRQKKSREKAMSQEFYLRYYVGHKGKFGHEFLEFELRNDGKFRYANNSCYKNEKIIRKEMYVSFPIIQEFQKMLNESEILKEDDVDWPAP